MFLPRHLKNRVHVFVSRTKLFPPKAAGVSTPPLLFSPWYGRKAAFRGQTACQKAGSFPTYFLQCFALWFSCRVSAKTIFLSIRFESFLLLFLLLVWKLKCPVWHLSLFLCSVCYFHVFLVPSIDFKVSSSPCPQESPALLWEKT